MCLGAGLHARILFHIESNGHWLQNVSKTSALILSIEKIEADNVTVSVQSDSDGSRTTKTIPIGENADGIVRSHHEVFDGINFYYELCFERILTDAV